MRARDLLLAFLREAPSADREPPTEFKIFPYGEIKTTKGTFKFTPEACDVLLAERAQHSADVQIDYDHLAIKAKKPGDGKAAGWCKLEKRDDGLYAVDVRWTPTGAQMLRDGEYRYFSPFFGATKDSKTIVMLMNVAITNLPAMQDLQALVAASLASDLDGVECVVKKEGDKYVLYSHEGKKLGEHPSKSAAERQESAINISKARKAGHRIPKVGAKEGENMKHPLGGYLAKHLKEKGLSMKAMADKAGMEEDRMRALHDGDEPTPEEMRAVEKACGLKEGEIDERLEEHGGSQDDNQDVDSDDEPVEPRKDDRDAPAKHEASRNSRKRVAASRRGREEDEVDEAQLDLVELTGTTDVGKQREMLKGVFAMASQFKDLKESHDRQQAEMVKARRESLIEQGKREGKLTPSLIRYYAKRPVADLEEFLKAAPTLSTQNLELREGENASVAALLTHEEIEVCRITHAPVEKMAQFVADQRAGKNQQLIWDSYYTSGAAK